MGLYRFAGVLLCGWFEMTSPLTAATATREVLVAVRQDAPPFASYAKGDQPGGFFWDICERAVDRAGYRLKTQSVSTTDRTQILQTGTTRDGVTPDLLCDPTTITLARMRNFDDLEGDAPALGFSPVVFIANGSYIQLPLSAKREYDRVPKGKKPREYCAEILSQMKGHLDPRDDPPRPPWWRPILFPVSNEPGLRFEVWGYVEGSTIGDALNEAIGRVGDQRFICPVPFSSHTEAAERFCEERIFRYFGDVELIRAALLDYFRTTGTKCQADESATNEGTYEPYAFVLSAARYPEFPERVTRALYAMFQDGTIDKLFASHFPGSEKSQYLDTLFRINSIPLGAEPVANTKSPGVGVVNSEGQTKP